MMESRQTLAAACEPQTAFPPFEVLSFFYLGKSPVEEGSVLPLADLNGHSTSRSPARPLAPPLHFAVPDKDLNGVFRSLIGGYLGRS